MKSWRRLVILPFAMVLGYRLGNWADLDNLARVLEVVGTILIVVVNTYWMWRDKRADGLN